MIALTLPDPCVVILCGASGSGKSTLATHLCADPTTEPISYDGCRAEISGNPHDQSVTPQAVALAHQRLAARCANRLSTVLDATHTNPAHRAILRDIATAHGLPTVLIALTTPLAVCLDRQRHRVFPVPDLVVAYQHTDITNTLPSLHLEGHYSVHILTTP